MVALLRGARRDRATWWRSVDRAEEIHQRVLDGDADAILTAVYLRIKEVGPDWLRTAFCDAYEKVRWAQAKSWDDVFGQPWPKMAHIKQRRTRMIRSAHIVHAVTTAHAKGEPIDGRLFDKVGQQFGLGGTAAKEVYYALLKFEEVQQWRANLLRLASKFSK
jgi:hypothetical protein